MVTPVRLDPEAVFDDGALKQCLGLSPTVLAEARRAGKLRYVRAGHRTLYTGDWILAWLKADSVTAVAS